MEHCKLCNDFTDELVMEIEASVLAIDPLLLIKSK